SAANAGSGIHCQLGLLLRHGKRVGLGCLACSNRNKATGLNDLVEAASIHNQVFNNWEGPRPPGFNSNRLPIAKMAHMELAGCRSALPSMRNTVDDERTGAANSFATVRIKRDGLLTLSDELFVDHIQHFQK